MKIRVGFVSNSSSSSFVISLEDITAKQLNMIENHLEIARNIGGYDDSSDERWDIEVNDYFVCGRTFMDNFDMECFLREIVRVPEEKVRWEYA